jgi:putative ABC transport system substrate-binding protein
MALATTLFVLLTCAAVAQTPAKTAYVGMLCPTRCAGIGYTAFDDELRKLGWIEGHNLTIERRGAEGHYERLPQLAAELVRLRPDLIIAASVQPALAAKNATSEIPVVFSFIADPVGVGLVQSLARPGGNVTGVTSLVIGSYLGKNFEVLRELLPKAQRVAVLMNPDNSVPRLRLPLELPMASQFGFQADVIEARTPAELPGAIAKAKALGADALLSVGDPVLSTPANSIPDLANQAMLPAIYQTREIVQAGGLISYSPDFLGVARRHAHYVDRILRGASPSGLPVEQPTKYDIIINLKTAETLGLTVPASLLSRVDEMIE